MFELEIWPQKLLWQDELNPRVRCAFGNVSFIIRKFASYKHQSKHVLHIYPLVELVPWQYFLGWYTFKYHPNIYQNKEPPHINIVGCEENGASASVTKSGFKSPITNFSQTCPFRQCRLIWENAIIVIMLSLIAHFRPSLNTSLSSFPQLWDKCSGNSTNLVTFSSPSFQEHNICAATTLDSQLWLYFNTNTAGKTSRDTCWHTQTPSYCP